VALLLLGLAALVLPANGLAQTPPRGALIGAPPATLPGTNGTPAGPAVTNLAAAHGHALPTNLLATARADGFQPVGFDRLTAFTAGVEITPEGPRFTGRIPGEVLALHGTNAAITGFMLPLKLREKSVTEFLVMSRLPNCCFGGPPQINEWVVVRMKSGGAEYRHSDLVVVCGQLQVGEYHENGRLRAIYRMDADKVLVPDRQAGP